MVKLKGSSLRDGNRGLRRKLVRGEVAVNILIMMGLFKIIITP